MRATTTTLAADPSPQWQSAVERIHTRDATAIADNFLRLSASDRRVLLVQGATDAKINSHVHSMVYRNAPMRGAVSSDRVIGFAASLSHVARHRICGRS